MVRELLYQLKIRWIYIIKLIGTETSISKRYGLGRCDIIKNNYHNTASVQYGTYLYFMLCMIF